MFPPEVKDQISYDTPLQQLRFIGLMTEAQRDKLLKLAPSDGVYKTAIGELYPGIVFPKELQGKIYYDPSTKELRFVGWMTEDEKKTLLNLSSAQPFQDAIQTFFNAPSTYVPDTQNQFMTACDVSKLSPLFVSLINQADRFGVVLEKLMPYLRRTLSESLIQQKLGEALKLEAEAIEKLLTEWIKSPADPARKSIAEFLDPTFAESNLNVKLTARAFRAPFKTFILLHKIAIVITRFKITPRQLAWLFDYGMGVGWLDFNTLPTPVLPDDPTEPAASFDEWERLVDLFQLRDALPLGETLLDDIFKLARDATTT